MHRARAVGCHSYHKTIHILIAFSGNVFEKRLIEAYIASNGTDPVTGEETSLDDLLPLKTARVVRPRPATLTSIPALLSTFQNEWDALALETYTLKQQLAQTRQELSTALYDYEGALRVIAKVTRERDEARDALSNVSVQGGAAANGDEMQVDNQPLPEAIAAKVVATQQRYGCVELCTFGGILMAYLVLWPRDGNDRYRKTGRQRRQSKLSARPHFQMQHCPAREHSLWTRRETWLCLVARMALQLSTRYHSRRRCSP